MPPVLRPPDPHTRRNRLCRVRLARLPAAPSPVPPEPPGARPTPGPRPPRRPRSLSAGRLPHVRSCGRHREALSASPGSQQRRGAGSDSVPPRGASLPQLRAAGGESGLLRRPPRRSQHPASCPTTAPGVAGGRRQRGLAAGECPRSNQGRNVAQAATWRGFSCRVSHSGSPWAPEGPQRRQGPQHRR